MSDPANEALSISVTESPNGVIVVALVGDLDLRSADELLSTLGELRKDASVVVDVSGLEFIDSSGLNALAVHARAVDDGKGALVVAGAPDHIARVFDVVRLAESVRVETSVADALRRAAIDAGRASGT